MPKKTQGRCIVFLDIDGVMQPHTNQMRFKHDREALRKKLAKDLDDNSYLKMDEYDLAAVYYDWDREAVERLRNLCRDFSAEIVISSDWRLHIPFKQLKAYFRIHQLDRYVTDKTGNRGAAPHYRAGEVKDYLDSHPEIERFVVIDDTYRAEFEALYPDQYVNTISHIEAKHEKRAREILSGVATPTS